MSGQVGRRLSEFRESIIVGELDVRVVEVSYGTRHSRWNSKRGTDLRADLVGINMVCEMGAMMAGIILEFLVLPRMIALILMMSLLVLYADFVGILGGAAVGLVS